jgi:hypothetical protein
MPHNHGYLAGDYFRRQPHRRISVTVSAISVTVSAISVTVSATPEVTFQQHISATTFLVNSDQQIIMCRSPFWTFPWNIYYLPYTSLTYFLNFLSSLSFLSLYNPMRKKKSPRTPTYTVNKIKVPQYVLNCSCNWTLLTVQEVTHLQSVARRNKWHVCNILVGAAIKLETRYC